MRSIFEVTLTIELSDINGDDWAHELTFNMNRYPAEPDVGFMHSYLEAGDIIPQDVPMYWALCFTFGKGQVDQTIARVVRRYLED